MKVDKRQSIYTICTKYLAGSIFGTAAPPASAGNQIDGTLSGG
jgi:hypothetical protein